MKDRKTEIFFLQIPCVNIWIVVGLLTTSILFVMLISQVSSFAINESFASSTNSSTEILMVLPQ
ncbi:MAG: hypothetical protein WAM14_17230, partial [Candidatus Nitrosopolaris sp.]